jgi:hypothetical protein
LQQAVYAVFIDRSKRLSEYDPSYQERIKSTYRFQGILYSTKEEFHVIAARPRRQRNPRRIPKNLDIQDIL